MANGLVVADVPAAFERGLQFRQAQQLRPLQQESARLGLQQQEQALQFGQRREEQAQALGGLQQQELKQTIDQRTDTQKNKSLFDTALRVDSARDDEIIPILQSQIQNVENLGGDASSSKGALELALAGDFEGVRRGAKNLIEVGVRQGDIEPLPTRKLSSLQQKVEAEGLDPLTPEGQARAREITQGSRTDPSLKPSDQQILNKANEGQLASASFATRVLSANENLTALENTPGFDPTSIQTAIFEILPGGNLALSEQEQSYAQSKRDFITAILRKESGAAIGKDEFANEDRKFFPQVGDKPSILKQKALGRKRTFENLKNQSKGVFDVQNKSKPKTGALSKAEQAELQQLRAELGGQ